MADNRKSYDLKSPKDMRHAGRPADSDLAEELLKLIAIGVAGGIATIAGAKKFGEKLQDMQEEAAKKAEAQREKYKEAVRKAVADEVEMEYENAEREEAITMRPSPLEEQPEEVDLILETTVNKTDSELTFEGQDEAEKRVADAMSAYDDAMDEAAGIK